MSGDMAHQVAERRAALASDPSSGWKLSDILIPITLYGDGVVPNDHGGISIEVLVMTILNLSPELQEKTWSKICLGYVNDQVTGLGTNELIENIQRYVNILISILSHI